MVGKMNPISRERLASLLDSATSSFDVHSKLENLRQFNQFLSEQDDPGLVSELLPRLFELQSDQHSAVRKCVAEIIGEIGLRHLEFVPEIVPLLLGVSEDRAPAVARQAITCGINLFRSTLGKIAVKGLYTSELDDLLKSSWSLMLEFKEKMYTLAFQPGSGGVRLLALKFVQEVILLYTPDPNASQEPPTHEGELSEFNVGWFRGGHPILNAGDLSIEASKRLGLLLDQLRLPTVKSLNNLVIIVIINSLATIAKKRPPYYGRILPVLLGLGPSGSTIEVMHAPGANHALRNALFTCLKCTHPGAAPWRDRLVGALKEMKAEGMAEDALCHILKSNGSIDEAEEISPVAMDEKITIEEVDAAPDKLGRKRSGARSSSELAEDSHVSAKRVKPAPGVSEESSKESNEKDRVRQDDIPSDGSAANRGDDDIGPVQQLVAMFGALVAQGEKAVGSLEILISSISADLLAEVVMANMRYLPTSYPKGEADDESLVNMTIVGSNTQAKYPTSFLSNVLSLSTSFPPIALQLNAHQSASGEIEHTTQDEECIHVASVLDTEVICTGINEGENEILPTGLLIESNVVSSGMEIDIPSDNHVVGNLESEIPGLDSFAHNNGLSETMGASSFVSTDQEDASQEQVTSPDGSPALDLHPAISIDRSEEHSPKVAFTDPDNLSSSTVASVGLPCALVLPKMSAPVVDLAEEHKDQLQNLAYMRIIEAYKQIAVAGGSQVRFSLLPYLGVEFPAELEPWKLLQKHILTDYVTYEGHEMTLRVLYRLFGEVEEERDLFSSTTAASVYEMFLLAVAETLRDSFPPSDKSLIRLLGEAPYLPKSILNLLESLCSPGSSDKAEKEFQSGDRVTQGLSTVWSLILLRPPIREVCLKIALQSAVHHLEEVRMKAIRLVANKLYPISSIARQIEEFALEKFLSVVNDENGECLDAKGSMIEPLKDSNMEKLSNDHQLSIATSNDAHQSSMSQGSSSLSIPEAQQCMSLYFALCTKKHSLFRQVFVIYKSSSQAVKQAVHRHIPILVRTMGSSSELLEIISDPPSGSENLLIQVLQTLTDGTAPSTELLFTIRKLYDSNKDIEILIPVLPFLPRDEVLLMFPRFVNLPPDKFQVALSRTLQASPPSGPVLTPAEVLIAIHGIDPEKDGIPLKKITDTCNACFEQRQIFTQQVIAKVLNHLVEQIPLPLLFMRTVLQAVGAFPALVDFIMEILSRLVTKQIWKYPKLWVGFLKCALLTKPQSFGVLLQLPPPQLENALNRTAALKAPLVAHASQPNIKSSLPRSILVVLGIATESQTSNQAQTSQSHVGDTSNSEEVPAEKSKETSSAS